jgi:hypothetical protein
MIAPCESILQQIGSPLNPANHLREANRYLEKQYSGTVPFSRFAFHTESVTPHRARNLRFALGVARFEAHMNIARADFPANESGVKTTHLYNESTGEILSTIATPDKDGPTQVLGRGVPGGRIFIGHEQAVAWATAELSKKS